MKTIEKNCRCGYRIRGTFGANFKVKYQDHWLGTFNRYSDATNFIDDHIKHKYENDVKWASYEDEPMKVKIVK